MVMIREKVFFKVRYFKMIDKDCENVDRGVIVGFLVMREGIC